MKALKAVVASGLLTLAGLGSAMAQGTDEGRFKKVHFRMGSALLASGFGSTLSANLESWGFGDDRTDWALFWTITTHYPRINAKGRFDLQLEYSITRQFALGLAVSALGNVRGKGYDRLGADSDGVSFGNWVREVVWGTAYFLSASYMPLRKPGSAFSPRAGLEVGMSDIELAFETSIENKVLKGKRLCGLVFAGLDVWPLRSLSVGLTLQYRYVPFKPGAFEIGAEYAMTYHIPDTDHGLNGVALGICVGLHL